MLDEWIVKEKRVYLICKKNFIYLLRAYYLGFRANQIKFFMGLQFSVYTRENILVKAYY